MEFLHYNKHGLCSLFSVKPTYTILPPKILTSTKCVFMCIYPQLKTVANKSTVYSRLSDAGKPSTVWGKLPFKNKSIYSWPVLKGLHLECGLMDWELQTRKSQKVSCGQKNLLTNFVYNVSRRHRQESTSTSCLMQVRTCGALDLLDVWMPPPATQLLGLPTVLHWAGGARSGCMLGSCNFTLQG